MAFFYFQFNLFSQPLNILQNGGFENYDTCIFLRSNLINAIPWFGSQCGYSNVAPFEFSCSSGSSDFYHTCQGEIPNLFILGTNVFQNPRSGNGMAGAGIVYIPNNEGREYLEVTLSQKLNADKKYCGSFYVNTPRNGGTMVSGIGMALTADTLLQVSTPDCLFCIIDTQAAIQSPINEVITDSAGWTCIKAIYKAQGNELMMTAGSFLPWDSMLYQAVPPYTYGYAYYFFDDFSVVELPDFSISANKDSICAGDSVLLTAKTSTLWQGLQHRWYAKSNFNINDSLLLNTYVNPLQTTTYYFQFFDNSNEVPCLVDYIDSITVYVKPAHNIILYPTDTIICSGESISIGVDSLSNLQYHWTPPQFLSNAQSSLTQASPTYTIAYTLFATTDSLNRQCLILNSASTLIEVIPCPQFDIPIIPDHLKYGNNLEIKNLYANTSLEIYNLIGQLIYVSHNYQNNWIALISSGVYLVRLSYVGSYGALETMDFKLIVLK